MRTPDATRSANFAAGMGFALVRSAGGRTGRCPKYLLTELPLPSTLKQGTIDAFALSSTPASYVDMPRHQASWLHLCSLEIKFHTVMPDEGVSRSSDDWIRRRRRSQGLRGQWAEHDTRAVPNL